MTRAAPFEKSCSVQRFADRKRRFRILLLRASERTPECALPDRVHETFRVGARVKRCERVFRCRGEDGDRFRPQFEDARLCGRYVEEFFVVREVGSACYGQLTPCERCVGARSLKVSVTACSHCEFVSR